MKDISEVVACVWDAGTFPSIAQTLAQSMQTVYYHSPWECEYIDLHDCVIGDGLEKVERMDDPLDPPNLEKIDLFIFPDIGFGGTQRLLRSMGKAVFGSMGFSDFELYRTRFIKLLDKLGLPHVPTVTIRGVTALSEHLKGVTNKWVKINRYRGNMETWHHIDWDHSQRKLEKLAVVFGGMKEYVVFVVQDPIDGDEDEPVIEIGYDGWDIDGESPESSYQGFEAKNQLYLGSVRKYTELPEEVRAVNEAMAPEMRQYGYRNFWATEIRKKGDKSNFIDPTARMPGQTGEQLLETCTNLPKVIWHGAHGELIKPEFDYKFAAEATLHYTEHEDDVWKVLRVPEKEKQWFKLYQFCEADGLHHFPPSHSDELGVVLGVGESVEDAIDHLKKNLEAIGDEPVSSDLSGFADLIEQIEVAESEGMNFGDANLPDPSIAVES
jgi:hypothetical protein